MSPSRVPTIAAAVCFGIYAISFIIDRSPSFGAFQIFAILLWSSAAWAVLNYPRPLGLLVGIVALSTVALDFHLTRSAIADYATASKAEVRPIAWVRYWMSMSPLVGGGCLALLSFRRWSGRSKGNPETKLGEQDVGLDAG